MSCRLKCLSVKVQKKTYFLLITLSYSCQISQVILMTQCCESMATAATEYCHRFQPTHYLKMLPINYFCSVLAFD